MSRQRQTPSAHDAQTGGAVSTHRCEGGAHGLITCTDLQNNRHAQQAGEYNTFNAHLRASVQILSNLHV
eukprot:758301-Pyramimonas_sp.AAC.1